MKVNIIIMIMLILLLANAECRHKNNKKNEKYKKLKQLKEQLKKRLQNKVGQKKKWNNYRDLEYKPCELKSGIVGYAIEFTHSLSEDNKYLVGIKSVGTKVEMGPKDLVVYNIHDLTLELKRIPMLQIVNVNIPILW